MCVMKDLDRFHLVADVIDRVPRLGARAASKQAIRDKLMEHKEYIARYGDDMPDVKGWTWGRPARCNAPARPRQTMSEQAAPLPQVCAQRRKLAGAILDVDGVPVASPHEQAWREALAGYADPARFTTEFYQTHVAGKPLLDCAPAL
jgi:hypothetical protein